MHFDAISITYIALSLYESKTSCVEFAFLQNIWISKYSNVTTVHAWKPHEIVANLLQILGRADHFVQAVDCCFVVPN